MCLFCQIVSGEAEAHFAKAQSLDPADADIARALAEVRAQRGVR